MTTSQCSKSHPSRRIVSLGGQLLQLGDESRSEDVAGCVERNLACGGGGVRRCRLEEGGDRAERAGGGAAAEGRARRSARDAEAIGENPSRGRTRRRGFKPDHGEIYLCRFVSRTIRRKLLY
jgi:hypothetical protein